MEREKKEKKKNFFSVCLRLIKAIFVLFIFIFYFYFLFFALSYFLRYIFQEKEN